MSEDDRGGLFRQVVVLSGGSVPETVLGEAIELEGYQVKHVPAGENIGEAAKNPESDAAVAVVVSMADESDEAAVLRRVVEQIPSAGFIILAAGNEDLRSALFPDPQDADQVLWIGPGTKVEDILASIRCFLRGGGYFWASEIQLRDVRDVFLLESPSAEGERVRNGAKCLSSFVSHLSGFAELEPMLDEALRECMKVLRCHSGSIYLWDEGEKTLVLKVAEGPEQDKRQGLRQRLGEGLAGWVAEVGEAMLVTDMRKVRKLKSRRCERYEDPGCLASPLINGDKLLGVLCLTMRENGEPFQPGDLRLAWDLCQELGSLMSPLAVLAELRRVNERLVGLFRHSSHLLLQKDSEVAEARALSADILDGVPIGVIAYDEQLRVRFSNTAAQELVGAQVQQGSNIPLEDGLDMDPEEWRRTLRGVLSSARGFRLHRTAYCSGDRTLRVDIHGSPLHDSSGTTVGGILTVQDVTKDVEMEEKLISAERLAVVGKVAAKVAHELNNPLDGILRFLSLAVRKIQDDPDKTTRYLRECRQGLLRMSNTLTQLLAFSRSKSNASQPLPVHQTIRDCISLYEERMRSMNTEVHVDVPSPLPSCLIPELFEALSNVIKNALEAMGENGVLTVRAVEEADLVRITVSDNGPGVPVEIREKIFEPFFSMKTDGANIGLGLAMCRDTLRRMGGEIRLCLAERGAAFEISVPVEE